jgi:DNA-binding LacI/PurR family transcriptional regulator
LISGVHVIEDFVEKFEGLSSRDQNSVEYIFFRTDRVAIPALHYFEEKGISIPDQIKVISMDNFSFSEYCRPALSTYDMKFSELGTRAFEILYSWISGEENLKKDFREEILPSYIERGSC